MINFDKTSVKRRPTTETPCYGTSQKEDQDAQDPTLNVDDPDGEETLLQLSLSRDV